MDAGQLVPDEVVIGLVRERIARPDARERGVLFDGFPRTVPQADALGEALEQTGSRLDAVVNIDVDHEAIVDRITSRRQCRGCGRVYNAKTDPPSRQGVCDACGGEVYQRDDDSEETVRNRLETYESQTRALIPYYEGKGLLHTVDGNQDPEAVFADLRSVLRTVA
jgi:adenylate kinase